MTNKIFLLTLMLIPFLGMGQNQQPDTLRLTLQDCLHLVNSNNYNRQSIALNESLSEDVYKQSKMERLPNLSASFGETYTYSHDAGSDWSGNYSLNTDITIYKGGYINNNIKKSKLSAEQSAYLTAQYDNDLTIQVLQSFLTALGNEELLKYQDAVLNASEEQLRQGKSRFETGEILESDLMLLKAQYENDRNNILEATINLNNSLNVLKGLMSLDLSQQIEIIYLDDSLLEQIGIMPSEEEMIKRSFETLPELRISDYNVEIAEVGVSIARSAYIPTLSLGASIGTGHMNNFSNYGTQISDRLNEQVGISLNVPIYNRNRTKSSVTQSRIALQQAELERKQTELDVRQTLIQEYQSVVAAESKFHSSQISRDAYESSFNTYRLMFEQGTITAVELLQQQNNYISAMNNYIQSKYSFILKRKVLDVFMGISITMN